jgi:hypothetical protein
MIFVGRLIKLIIVDLDKWKTPRVMGVSLKIRDVDSIHGCAGHKFTQPQNIFCVVDNREIAENHITPLWAVCNKHD